MLICASLVEMAHAMYEQLKAAQASEKGKAAENSELELKVPIECSQPLQVVFERSI